MMVLHSPRVTAIFDNMLLCSYLKLLLLRLLLRSSTVIASSPCRPLCTRCNEEQEKNG